MPSTRKRRAKERQADMMSDVDNLDVMLGSYSRNVQESNSEDRNIEVHPGSDKPREDVNYNVEDFRSLLNSNRRVNSEITLETVRLVITEISKRLDELKRDLNTQIMDSINSAINEKILPGIQNTSESQ